MGFFEISTKLWLAIRYIWCKPPSMWYSADVGYKYILLVIVVENELQNLTRRKPFLQLLLNKLFRYSWNIYINLSARWWDFTLKCFLNMMEKAWTFICVIWRWLCDQIARTFGHWWCQYWKSSLPFYEGIQVVLI